MPIGSDTSIIAWYYYGAYRDHSGEFQYASTECSLHYDPAGL